MSVMTLTSSEPAAIIRTERGLAIAGTRITLYDVMDLLKAQYPIQYIRDSFNLTNEQVQEALNYIQAHCTEVEAEYQEILDLAETTREYWEERNRDRIAQIAAMPPCPGTEGIQAKLQKRRAQQNNALQ